MKTTTMEIKLSKRAAAVLDIMTRHSGVTARAIGRVCVELTLAQAIDRSISEEGEEWYIHAAMNSARACRKAWQDVNRPGFIYHKALRVLESPRRKGKRLGLRLIDVAAKLKHAAP